MFERDEEGRVFNTASVIDPDGALVCKVRKMFPVRPYETGVEAGTGFRGLGVPLTLHHVLQACSTTAEAVGAPARIPMHLCHTVVAPNRNRAHLTAHARTSATVKRERFLLPRLTLHLEPQEKFIAAFLNPPLNSVAFDRGFGTLCTAVYRPRLGEVELRWPRAVWRLSIDAIADGERRIYTPDMSHAATAQHGEPSP